MKWTFKWAKQLESGIYHEQLLPRGFVKPEDQEPNTTGLDFYIDAFQELSTCRPGGMGLQAIPFTAIIEYTRIYGIDEDLDEFAYVIRRMDNAFIKEYVAEQQRGNSGNANANAQNNNKR